MVAGLCEYKMRQKGISRDSASLSRNLRRRRGLQIIKKKHTQLMQYKWGRAMGENSKRSVWKAGVHGLPHIL